MSLTHLLAQYGYVLVFLGTVLEGETVLLLAGVAAYQGHLWLPLVIAVGFCGGTIGDQVLFFLGRHYGTILIDRFPGLAARARPVQHLVRRHDAMLIVAVRFMYGLRLAGPLLIGTCTVTAWRFVVFNVVGAAIWAALVAGAGFVFGQAVQWLFADIAQYQEAAMWLVLALAALWGLGRWLHSFRRSRLP